MRGYPDNGKLNDALDLAEQHLLNCYRTHRAQGLLPDAEALRAAVVPALVEEVAQQAALTFWQHLDEWIAQKRGAGLLATARTYATAARHLREFSQASRYAVDFDTITASFGQKFTAYLVGPAHLTDNTVHKVLTRFKVFMKWAGEHGLHTNTYYQRLTWTKREPRRDDAYHPGGGPVGGVGPAGRWLPR